MKLRVYCCMVCMTLWCALLFGQTGEMDEDGASINIALEREESEDRLRLDPFDLRKASVTDLLRIPGIGRQEAMLILQAARSGLLTRLEDMKQIPGITYGVYELLAPFVILSEKTRGSDVSGLFRVTARAHASKGPWTFLRSTHQVLLRSSVPGALASTGMFNLRWEGNDDLTPRIHASSRLFDERMEIDAGHLSFCTGSPLLDRTRRPGLFRSSDWGRSMLGSSSIRTGIDDETLVRGFTMRWRTEERNWCVGRMTDESSDIFEILAIDEEVSHDIRWTASWRSDINGVSWGVRHDATTTGLRIEMAQVRHALSGFVFGRWATSTNLQIQIQVRQLRGISAGGVARQGSGMHDEDGGTVSILWRSGRLWKTQWTMDASRLRITTAPNGGPWSDARGIGILNEVTLSPKVRMSGEWGWNLKLDGTAHRGTLAWTHDISRAVEWHSAFSLRRETGSSTNPRVGRMLRSSLRWVGSIGSLTIRWTGVRASDGIQFWNVGPGPSVLGGIRPLSGLSTLFQAVAQGQVRRQLLAAIVVSQSMFGGVEGPPDVDLTASILLEFRL